MNRKLATGVAIVVAAGAAMPAAAGVKQRVAITVKGTDHTFVLTPLTRGALKSDSGTESGCCWTQRFVTRGGQRIEINDPLVTLAGKHGTLELRYRIEWLDAGNYFSVGIGTWRVVGGTGAYAHLTGSGRSAHSWPPTGFASGRSDGFLSPH